MLHVLSVCVYILALALRRLNRMRRTILSPVVCPALPHFPTLSHKWQDFRENIFEHKMSVLIFSIILSETFLILRRI